MLRQQKHFGPFFKIENMPVSDWSRFLSENKATQLNRHSTILQLRKSAFALPATVTTWREFTVTAQRNLIISAGIQQFHCYFPVKFKQSKMDLFWMSPKFHNFVHSLAIIFSPAPEHFPLAISFKYLYLRNSKIVDTRCKQ